MSLLSESVTTFEVNNLYEYYKEIVVLLVFFNVPFFFVIKKIQMSVTKLPFKRFRLVSEV